mgnify:FL=1|nr:MAG TPA: hypothetical protein [Bacteriophage sp.]
MFQSKDELVVYIYSMIYNPIPRKDTAKIIFKDDGIKIRYLFHGHLVLIEDIKESNNEITKKAVEETKSLISRVSKLTGNVLEEEYVKARVGIFIRMYKELTKEELEQLNPIIYGLYKTEFYKVEIYVRDAEDKLAIRPKAMKIRDLLYIMRLNIIGFNQENYMLYLKYLKRRL